MSEPAAQPDSGRPAASIRVDEAPAAGGATQFPKIELGRELRGYSRQAVDELLGRIATSFEKLAQERAQLLEAFTASGKRREELEAALERRTSELRDLERRLAELAAERDGLAAEQPRYRDLESTLSQALLTAERTGAQIRSNAQREAQSLLEDAQARARQLIGEAEARREGLLADARAVRGILEASLDVLDDPLIPAEPTPPAGEDERHAGG